MNDIIAGLIGALVTIAGLLGLNYYNIVTTVPETSFGATPVLTGPQGGTGIGSTTAAQVADCLVVADDSPFTWTISDCAVGGSGLTSYDAFTHPFTGWSATTAVVKLTGGLFASSTVLIDNSTTTNATTTSLAILNLTSASCDVKASTAGILSCGTDANSGLSTYDAWTHPAAGQSATTSLLFMAGLVSTASSTINGNLNILGNATATNATTTNLYVTNPPTFSTLTSALLLTGSTGILAEFAGTSCTNQTVTALSALGAATCTTITSAFVDSSILTTATAIDIDQVNGDTSDDDDLDVAAGGTGVSTITGLLQGNGTSDVTAITNSSTAGQILRVTGASTYAWGALDLDDTDAWTGTLPIANTQLVAGRSLTLSTDTVDADAELYTISIGANLFATSTSGLATTTEFDMPAIYIPFAATITGFNCFADTSGTSTIKATASTNPLVAGTDLLYTSGVACGSQVHTSTTTFSSTAITAGSWIRFYVATSTSRPMTIFPFFTATKND